MLPRVFSQRYVLRIGDVFAERIQPFAQFFNFLGGLIDHGSPIDDVNETPRHFLRRVKRAQAAKRQ